MKFIPLSQGKQAIVDDCDYDRISQFTWCVKKQRHGAWIAATNIYNPSDQTCRTVTMHRVILDAPQGMEVDHKNHDSLDNRRDNLRLCSHAENSYNRKVFTFPKSSKYKGVTWSKNQGKWRAHIRFNGKLMALGSFNSEVEAAMAYDQQAKRLYGDFAWVNSGNLIFA